LTNQETEEFIDQIRESALVLLTTWALQGFNPDVPFFQEIPEDLAALFSAFGTSIASATSEPPESISLRRGLEFLLFLAAHELNFPMPHEVRDRLLCNIFGRPIADALDLGATIDVQGKKFVVVYPELTDETVH
jgi:hypothetical protein